MNTFCKCGSIKSDGKCSNPNCGKTHVKWAKDCKKYEEDLKLGNELVFKTSAMEAQHGYEKFHHLWEW